MSLFRVSLFCAAVAASPAVAGAWMRDTGTAFVATSSTARGARSDQPLRYDSSLYAEYGLRPRLTIGADAFYDMQVAGHVLLFARFPLGPTDRRGRLALELGIGATTSGTGWGGMLKTGLSFGRGFSTKRGNGWVAVDAAVERRRDQSGPIYKLDATLGLPQFWKLQPMLQLESSYMPGKPVTWAVTPSLILKGKKGRDLVFGLEKKSADIDTLGLKVSIWRRF